MHRFQINPDGIKKGSVLLDEKESHHAASVLRLKTGDAVGLLDGKGHSFRGVVAGIENCRLRVRIKPDPALSAHASRRSLDVQITIAVSVIKPERMEILIQKACELGVTAIIPVRSERSIIKLSKERWQEKIKRWRKIAAESCKQCGLPAIPEIHEAVDLKNVLLNSGTYDKILIPTLAAPTRPLYEALKKSGRGRVLTLIGPEGDFTPSEIASSVACGAIPVDLGPWVLRTETAAIYLLSALNFFYREIDNGERSSE